MCFNYSKHFLSSYLIAFVRNTTDEQLSVYSTARQTDVVFDNEVSQYISLFPQYIEIFKTDFPKFLSSLPGSFKKIIIIILLTLCDKYIAFPVTASQ